MVSTAYNPTTNSQAKAFNKTMIKLLKKLVEKNKHDSHEKV